MFRRVALLTILLLSLLAAPAVAQSSPAIQYLQYNPIAPGNSECIEGAGFGATQDSSTLLLNGNAVSVYEWMDYEICLWTPSSVTPGPATFQVVTSVGSSNVFNFTVVSPPAVTGINPASGPPGTQATISGSSFGATQGGGSVWYQGRSLAITSWIDTQIVVTVPSGTPVGSAPFSVLAYRNWAVSANFQVTGPPVIQYLQYNPIAPGNSECIEGAGFGATQGSSTLLLNGNAVSVYEWLDYEICLWTPSSTAVGPATFQVVTSAGAGNIFNFAITGQPTITSISPARGQAGTQATISGTNFGAIQYSGSSVRWNGTNMAVVSWGDTQIVATIPVGLPLGSFPFEMTVNHLTAFSSNFTLTGPLQITQVTDNTGATSPIAVGSATFVNGSGFGDTQGSSILTFNGTAIPAYFWSDSSVHAFIPANTVPGSVAVQINTAQGATNTINITVTGQPTITGISPTSGPAGTQVTIKGNNFGAAPVPNVSFVFLGDVLSPISWSDTQIVVIVPPGAMPRGAQFMVVTNGLEASSPSFTITPSPHVASISPVSGPVGAQLTVTGSGFVSAQNLDQIFIGGIAASPVSWSDTQIVAAVPPAAQTGTVYVAVTDATLNYVNSNTLPFTVQQSGPTVAGITPASGPVGTQVTVAGSGFGSTQGASAVSFNGVVATVTNWSDTSIGVNVPSSATSGNVLVTVAGQPSNVVAFTVLLGSLSASYGPTPTAVTLTSPMATDWAHWGTSSDAPLVRSTETLSDFTVIGANAPVQFSDGEIEYIWTDGDVLPAASRVTTGVLVTGTGNGFHLSVPADTTPKTLTLYVGAFEAQGRLTASLNDSSAATFTDSSVDIVPSNGDHHVNGTYTLSFQASQPGQTLNIDYVLAVDHGPAPGVVGNITLQSAVLTAQQPSVALTSLADGQVFTFPADVPLAATATQNGAGIASVAFVNDAQTVFTLTNTPYSATLSGLAAGDHVLSVSATDANGLSATSSPLLISEIGSGGVLTASQDTPASVDLSAGSSDWVHWGNTIPDRKAGIVPQISDFKTLANGSSHSYDASPLNGVNYSWSSGTPTDAQTGTATQMRMQAYKNGFSLTVAADTTPRTLKLYVASGYGQSTLRASLSDGSVAPFVSIAATATAFAEKVYTIQFQAASAGQTLTITDQVTRDDGFAYVALESAGVLDQNPPHLDSVSPATAAPGAQITVAGGNFGTSQTTGQLTLGGVTMNVVSWSDSSITATVPLAQSGAVVVSRGLANSNGVPFVAILPPPPVIASIAPAAGGEGTLVTVFGTNFGATQNSSTVTFFNGVVASPVSWSDTQIVVPAPVGVHTGPVVVTTVSGPSNGVVFTFSPGIRFSLQSSYVTPDEATLEVGNSRSFNVVDASGNPVTDATWSVDTTTLATISADAASASSATLQALDPGEVTITATSASLGTAKAKATIYAVGTLPAGTPAWSFFPQTQDRFGFFSTIKARRNSADGPFLYFAESFFSGSGTLLSTVHAVDEGGGLKWRATLSPTDPTNSEAAGLAAVGTNDGGLLVEISECCNSFPFVFTHFGPDGKPAWNYTTLGFPESPALGPDGTIYFWSIGDAASNIPTNFVGLDDATGAEKFRNSPAISSSYSFVSAEPPDSTPCIQHPNVQLPTVPITPSHVSNPIVGTDGNAYMMAIGSDLQYTYSMCNVAMTTDPFTNSPVYTITLLDGNLIFNQSVALIRVTPTGDTVNIPVGTVSYSGEARWAGSWSYNNGTAQLPQLAVDRIAPDGQGGMLITWNRQMSAQGDVLRGFLTRVVDGSPSYTVSNGAVGDPSIFAAPPTAGDIATNDQGTAFFDSFNFNTLTHTITAVDVLSGAAKWASNAGSLMAATDNGGLLLNTPLGVQFIDANGNLGTDVLPTSGDASYLAEGEFQQDGPNGSVQILQTNDQLNTTLKQILAEPWPMPIFANSQQTKRAEALKTTELVETGETAGCTGFDNTIELHAVMAPASGLNPVTGQQVPEIGNSFNFKAPKGIAIRLVAADTNLLTLSVDDPDHPDQRLAVVPGDGVSHQVTLRGHGAVNPPAGIHVLAYDANAGTFLGFAFQGIVLPYQFWQIHKFEIGDAKRSIRPGDTPAATDIAAELNRIFYSQAHIQFGVTERGLVDAFDWDIDRDGKMHEPKSWDDPGNKEAGPLHTYITQTLDGTTSPLLTQSWTMYLYYINDFDNSTTEGFTVPGKGNRSIPSILKTQYNLQINVLNFMSNLTSHEIGHKLGLIDRKASDMSFIMDGVRTGNAVNRANNNPCKLDYAEWVKANKP